MSGQDLRLSGTVRIATIDMLRLASCRDTWLRSGATCPGIELEVYLRNAALNLGRREADVALRVGNDPPEALIGRRVGRLAFAVYGSTGYCAGRPNIPLERTPQLPFRKDQSARG